jgi:hypothetical protein
MIMGVLSVAVLVLVFLFWLLVIRPADRAHHERRLELLRRKIRAAEARRRDAAGGPAAHGVDAAASGVDRPEEHS